MSCPMSSTKDGSGSRNITGSLTSVPPWGSCCFHSISIPVSNPISISRCRVARPVWPTHTAGKAWMYCVGRKAVERNGGQRGRAPRSAGNGAREQVRYQRNSVSVPPARLVPRPCREGPDGEDRRGRAVHVGAALPPWGLEGSTAESDASKSFGLERVEACCAARGLDAV